MHNNIVLLVVGRDITLTARLILQFAIFQRESKDARELTLLKATLAGGRVGDVNDRDGEAAITGVLAV